MKRRRKLERELKNLIKKNIGENRIPTKITKE